MQSFKVLIIFLMVAFTIGEVAAQKPKKGAMATMPTPTAVPALLDLNNPDDALKADEMFRTLMGEKVEPRREFIQKHALEVKEIDYHGA